jgi:hypoxanthine phosphoribosyltransferase
VKYTENKIILSWNDIDKLISSVCKKILLRIGNRIEKYDIIAIAKGGVIPATIVSYRIGIRNIHLFPIVNKKVIKSRVPHFNHSKKYLLIDEIYDTGNTIQKVSKYLETITHQDIFLLKRYSIPSRPTDDIYGKILDDSRWIVFPWEQKGKHQS